MEEHCQERLGRSTELQGQDALKALATLKVELKSEHEKSCRAYFWFMCKNHQMRKPDLVWWSAIIQGFPCFWAHSCILSAAPWSLLLRRRRRDRNLFLPPYPGRCSCRAIHGPTAR